MSIIEKFLLQYCKKKCIFYHMFLCRTCNFFIFKNAESECRILSSETWPRFQIPFCLLSYVIPVTLICGLYIRMLLALWGAERINTSAENRRGKRRATRLVIVIVAVFTICWLPLQVSKIRFSSLF